MDGGSADYPGGNGASGMKTTFYQLPEGARFEFGGRQYQKVAVSMAQDDRRWGHIFLDECEVEWSPGPGEKPGEPKPPEPCPWWAYLSPAPPAREVGT